MNNKIYQLGIGAISFLARLPFLAKVLTAFSRVWLRQEKIRQFLLWGKFDSVIDGGANIGEFASLIRSTLPQAQLFCVEPHAPSAAFLRRKGYTVIEAALWHEKTRLNLSQPTVATTSCTVMPSDENVGVDTWEVEALRMEDLPVSGKNIFIKLDLQGAEIHALQGMETLWERCHAIMLEVSIGEQGSYEMLRDLLSEKGFAEYSTINELEEKGRVIEADKIWIRRV